MAGEWRDELGWVDSAWVTSTNLGSGDDAGGVWLWVTEQPGMSIGTKIINMCYKCIKNFWD